MNAHSPTSKPRPRRIAVRWMAGVTAAGLLALATGCTLTDKEFRTIAGPQLEAGINSILDGLVDGLFAVIEPDTTDDGST